MTSAGGKTIVFFPEPGAWGPTNNCVALGDVLRERGHRVVFVVDESFRGVLEARGFEEREMRMAPAEEAADPAEERQRPDQAGGARHLAVFAHRPSAAVDRIGAEC